MKKVAIGSVLIFFGLFMLLGFFVSTKDSPFLVELFTGLLFVAAPVLSGVLLLRSHFNSKQKATLDQKKAMLAAREKELIRFAQQKGGEVTIPEIVAATSMTSDEADEVLRELVIKRFADMKMTDGGVIVYEFFEIQQRQERPERNRDDERMLE